MTVLERKVQPPDRPGDPGEAAFFIRRTATEATEDGGYVDGCGD